MGETSVGNVPSVDNSADLATKMIGGGQKKNYLVPKILYDLAN